jgi:hypothetical protein
MKEGSLQVRLLAKCWKIGVADSFGVVMIWLKA